MASFMYYVDEYKSFFLKSDKLTDDIVEIKQSTETDINQLEKVNNELLDQNKILSKKMLYWWLS